MFGKYSYLIYMLIFTVIPITVIWIKYYLFLKTNIKIVILMSVIGIVFQSISDPFAESWRAWFFGSDKILNIWIWNFPIENLIFFFLVSIAISSAILGFIRHYQKRGEL